MQATIDIRFVWHPVCALLRISPDICADNPPPTPYFQLSLHTSQLPNRHLRNQSLTHALSGILHAHMSSLCLPKHPSVIPSPHPVILSDSEESGSSSLIFSSSPSPDMCAGIHRYTLCMASRLRTSPHFPRHLRRQSPSHAVFPTFPAHISTPKPTSAQPILDSRPEWHPPRAHVLSLSPKTPFCHSERQRRIWVLSPVIPNIPLSPQSPSCHSERQRRICFLPSHILLFSFSRHVHVCRQPSIYALYGILPAHFSAFLPTSAQPNLDSRPECHPLCALLGISSDICADNPSPIISPLFHQPFFCQDPKLGIFDMN